MAVVISSQFYQASLWKNISKIVFTSPNMDSPAIAGTRSHILPGEGDLATWYEDTANMYRIEDSQWETNSDFFNYRMKCKDTIEILDHAGYIDVKEANYSSLDTFIKENSGVEVVGYLDNTSYITNTKPRLEYTLTQFNLNEIYNTTDTRVREVVERREMTDPNPGSTTKTRAYYTLTFNKTVGSVVKVIPGSDFSIIFVTDGTRVIYDISISSIQANQELAEIPVETLFSNPIPLPTITKLIDTSIFFGEYFIYGSNTTSVDTTIWTPLHHGFNTNNLICNITLSAPVVYNYLKLVITSNVGLNSTIFNTDFYGVSKVAINTNTPPPPIPTTSILTVSPVEVVMPCTSSNGSISILNIGGGTMVWVSSVDSESWITITSSSAGVNTGVVDFTVDSNSESLVRTATISVTATGATNSPIDVYIIQAAADVVDQPILSVTPLTASTSNAASTSTLATVSNTGTGTLIWTAEVTTGGTWFSITSGSSGSGTGTIEVLISANTGAQRTATVRVTAAGATGSPKDITITQAAADLPILSIIPQAKYKGSLSSYDNNLFAISNIGTGTMPWVAEIITGGSWFSITITGGCNSGTNTGYIGGTIQPNTGLARVATIMVTCTEPTGKVVINSPQQITLTQSAAGVVDQPILSLSTQIVNIGSTVINGNLATVSNAGTGTMAWTATVIVGTWLELGVTSGTNTGTITFGGGTNTGAQRTATVRVTAAGATDSPKDITITQAAAGVVDQPILSLSTQIVNIGSTVINGNLATVSNAGTGTMAWTATVIVGTWLELGVTSGTNTGTIKFGGGTNTGAQRTATVRVTAAGATGSPKDITITQAAAGAFSISKPTIDDDTTEQLISEDNASILYGAGALALVTLLISELSDVGGLSPIISVSPNPSIKTWTAASSSSWISLSPNNGYYKGGVISGLYSNNLGMERSSVITITIPDADNSPITRTIKQKMGSPKPISINVRYAEYNDKVIDLSGSVTSIATGRVKEIVDTKTLTGSVMNIPRTLLYYIYTLDRNKGWYTPVNIDVSPHIIFTFPDPTKITAMYISSVQVNQELWQIPTNTLFNTPTPAATTTLTPKTYFIGNFNVQGSNDQIIWVTIYTGANTTKPTKTAYFSNTQYYKYYKLNILNNTGLSTTVGTPPVVNTVFDVDYYGIRSLKFYVNDFSTEAGSTFVALYEFSDFSNPKIMKISNAATIPSTTPEENTTTTSHSVKGLLTETRVSGGVTLVSGVYQTVFYSSYAVNIKSSTDPYDYLTTATCISPTDGGVGTSTISQTYTKQDKINTVVSSIVERGNQGKIDEYLLFRSTGTTTVPINTADWTGLVDITYATSTSGTVISGVLATNIAGATERKYESSLYSRRDSFRLTVSDYVTTSGIITEDTDLYMWGFTNRLLDLDCQNSVVFEITNGEAYNCRLTAWDDVTHSTTKNELIQGDHVRCSAMVYCCTGSKLVPAESKVPLNLVYPPVHNRIFKGNTIDGTNKLFYGDFDMVYRYQSTVYGDFLIFKPLLYGINESISYGVHDYLITFHYSYT